MLSVSHKSGVERMGRGVQVALAAVLLLGLSSGSIAFVSTAARSRQLSVHAGGSAQASTMRGTTPAMQTFAPHHGAGAFTACALFAAAAAMRAIAVRSQQNASPRSAAVKMMAVSLESGFVDTPARPAARHAKAHPMERLMPEVPKDAVVPDLLDFSSASIPSSPSPYQASVTMSAVVGAFEAASSTKASRSPSAARFAGGARCRAARAGASRGAERTARRAVGAKLQAATTERFQVQPAPYDPSCIRGKIQVGLRVQSSLCSLCGRESKSSLISGEVGVLSTGERIQLLKCSNSESNKILCEAHTHDLSDHTSCYVALALGDMLAAR